MGSLPESLLLIDDNLYVQSAVKNVLNGSGTVRVEIASSCDEAFEKLESFSPDIIMLDLHMPGKNGIETLNDLRKIPKLRNIPVVFITGDRNADELHNFGHLGVIGVIQKDVTLMGLVKILEQLWHDHNHPCNIQTHMIN